MATLADSADIGDTGPKHLFLAGDSKVGKTDWIADAAIQGFTILYVDADNGKGTLMKRLAGDSTALSRVHYVRTTSPFDFMMALFGKIQFKWNVTQDREMKITDNSDDRVTAIIVKKIPRRVILVLDSWTSTMLELLKDAAERASVPFEDFNEGGQGVYGDAARRANLLCSYFRDYHGDSIVQGHGTWFERYEKPLNSVNAKQKEFILKETKLVPESCSRVHGYGMAKFFNEFGWMRLKNTGQFELSFKQEFNRVGGGSLQKNGDPKVDLTPKHVFGPPPEEMPENDTWILDTDVQYWKDRMPAPVPKPAASTAATDSAPKTLPAKGLLGR